jgi:hypothetical protein
VVDRGTQSSCGPAEGEPVDNDELVHGVQVDVVGVASGQGQVSAAGRGRLPGQRLVDAELLEVAGGVLGERVAQRRCQRRGEVAVLGAVVEAAEGEGVGGVGQVVAGE